MEKQTQRANLLQGTLDMLILRTLPYGSALGHQIGKLTDPVTFLAASAVMTAVTMAASYIPARRAASVDPMQALRSE